MRMLLCSPFRNTSPDNLGGITIWTRNIWNYYLANYCQSDIYVQIFDTARDFYVTQGISVFRRIYEGVKEYSLMAKRLKKTLENGHFDAIHLSTSASISLVKDLWFARTAHKAGAKAFVHFHFGRIPQILERKGWECILLRKVLEISDAVMVMDMHSYDVLHKEGYSNVHFLPNPLSQEVTPIVSKEPQGRNSREILFVGHVIEAKGVRELVSSVKEIGNARLKLLGHVEDDMKSELRRLAGENSEEWFDLPGGCSYSEVIKAMCHCDVFCLPSYTEGFPYVILESMACGCLVLATNVGAIPEMLDVNGPMPCGICIPVKDKDSLRDKLQYCLDKTEETMAYRTNAQKRVLAKYSLEMVFHDLLNIWRKYNYEK